MKFLFLIAVIPAVLLLNYVYKMDKLEKEPKGLIVKLMIFGAISTIPAIVLELIAEGPIMAIFGEEGNVSAFANAFVGIALIEEFCKWFMLNNITKRSSAYNCVYDGLVYSVAVSLGFALLENIGYVFIGGVGTALVRAFTAIPGHMFFGVIMGEWYSKCHIQKNAKSAEEVYVRQGILNYKPYPEFSGKAENFKGLLFATLAHGAYDFFAMAEGDFFIILFIGFLIFLYIMCFKKIKTLSANDAYLMDSALNLLTDKYPELPAILEEQRQRQEQQSQYAAPFSPDFYGGTNKNDNNSGNHF